jgi:hypothetical protein
LAPERDIDDPALQRMKLGPDVEPSETELLKTQHEDGEVAATGHRRSGRRPALGLG